MEYDWSMNERVKEIRLMKDMKQGELAKIIGIRQSSLSDIENKRVKVSDRVIKDLVMGLSVNEGYIRFGKGDPFSKTPSSTMQQLKQEYRLDDFDYNLVYEYLKLDEEKRASIRNFFYNVVTSGKNMPAEELTRQKIEEEVEDYRRELELEAKGETLSAYEDTGETKNA